MGSANQTEEDSKQNDTIQSQSQSIEQIIDERRSTYDNPLFPLPRKETVEKFIKMAEDIGTETDFYDTNYYHDLIPYKTNINWPFAPLQLIGASIKEHNELLDKIKIPDDEHKYTKDIQTALDCFNKWRKYKDGSPKDWIFKKKENNVSHFEHIQNGENLNVYKGESVILYNTSIIAGILLNGEHRSKYDKAAGGDELIDIMSLTSFVIHSIITTPVLIADRDLCVIMFVYAFRDGSIIIGSKSIKHDKKPIQSTPVRADITNIWHIRPYYENNMKYSRVTYYLQMDLGGSLPYSSSNDAAMNACQAIYNVGTYIKSIHYELNKRGTLHIPPYPMLKNLGIDVGWMDIERTDDGNDVDHDKKKDDEITDDVKESEKKQVFPMLVAKEYVFKSMDKENKKIVCLDKDFNDIEFDLSLSNKEVLQKINGVIVEGKEQKKDVMISVVEKKNGNDDDMEKVVLLVSDAKIA